MGVKDFYWLRLETGYSDISGQLGATPGDGRGRRVGWVLFWYGTGICCQKCTINVIFRFRTRHKLRESFIYILSIHKKQSTEIQNCEESYHFESILIKLCWHFEFYKHRMSNFRWSFNKLNSELSRMSAMEVEEVTMSLRGKIISKPNVKRWFLAKVIV